MNPSVTIIFARCLALSLGFGWSVAAFVPVPALIALAGALLFLTIGATVPASGLLFMLHIVPNSKAAATNSDISWQMIGIESISPFFVGLLLGAFAYVAQLSGAWIGITAGYRRLSTDLKTDLDLRRGLTRLLQLTALCLLFRTGASTAMLAGMAKLVLSPGMISQGMSNAASVQVSRSLVNQLGQMAQPMFAVALLLALPIFFVTILLDLSAAVLSAFSRRLRVNEAFLSFRLPIIAVVLLLSLLPLLHQLQSFIEYSLRNQVKTAVEVNQVVSASNSVSDPTRSQPASP